MNAGTNYLVIGKYDFDSDIASASIYAESDTLPTSEPSSWDVETNMSAAVTRVNRIQIQAGAFGGGNQGETCFDEVRVATTFGDLLMIPLDPPSNTTATADGAEAVDLTWAKDGGGHDVLIVQRTGSAPNASPTNGSGYAAGASLGGGTVIFNGSATRFKAVELTPGSTSYFVFYSLDASTNYSSGVTNSAVLESYGDPEIIEPFSYDLAEGLNNQSGGHDFTNNWIESNAGSFVVETGTFSNISGFPPHHGHQISVTPPSVIRTAIRRFDPFTCGKIYFSSMMRYDFPEVIANMKFVGISLMNGSTEELFAGELSGTVAGFGVDPLGDGSSDGPGTGSMNPDVDYLEPISNSDKPLVRAPQPLQLRWAAALPVEGNTFQVFLLDGRLPRHVTLVGQGLV